MLILWCKKIHALKLHKTHDCVVEKLLMKYDLLQHHKWRIINYLKFYGTTVYLRLIFKRNTHYIFFSRIPT